jgi:catechol 2,3-dioxygenase-like lactoylglutathione lyase family enzyme
MTDSTFSLYGRVDNSDINTRDVQRLVDFYHGVLGLPFFLPYEEGQGWAAIDTGGLVFYIFPTEVGEHPEPRTTNNEENPPGLDSFAFAVEDLDVAIAALEGKVDWFDAEIGDWHHPSGVWYRYRGFHDPDGNLLYVTEPHTEESLRA